MADSSPARLLAPIALAVFFVAVMIVVVSSDSEPTVPPGATTAAEIRPARLPPRTYLVRPGETLTTISEKFAIPLARLRALNPDVDPQSLRAGRRIKLRR